MDRRSWLKLSLSGTAALIMGTDAPALQPRKVPPKGFRTGLEAIDDYAGCWDRGDLITVIGEAGSGKTAVGCQIAKTNTEDGHKVAVLTDGDEFQWKMSGAKTEWMPDYIADGKQWNTILESLNADLIIIDAHLPFFYTEEYKKMGGLSYHRMHAAMLLLQHCHQFQRSAIITVQTRRFPVKFKANVVQAQPSLVSYMSSRIFRLDRRTPHVMEALLMKHREGPGNIVFLYEFHDDKYGIKLKPCSGYWI